MQGHMGRTSYQGSFSHTGRHGHRPLAKIVAISRPGPGSRCATGFSRISFSSLLGSPSCLEILHVPIRPLSTPDPRTLDPSGRCHATSLPRT
jgi:hypothetical protein